MKLFKKILLPSKGFSCDILQVLVEFKSDSKRAFEFTQFTL